LETRQTSRREQWLESHPPIEVDSLVCGPRRETRDFDSKKFKYATADSFELTMVYLLKCVDIAIESMPLPLSLGQFRRVNSRLDKG
jgi:hypothetical protein